MKIKGRFGSKTDIGLVRASNEDKALSLIDAYGNVLLCVCDGMGGYMKGEVASKIATDTISNKFRNKKRWFFSFQVSKWINNVVKLINAQVWNEANTSEKCKGMGTTLVLAIFFKDKIFLANVGDSRCYILEDKELKQLTRDQTYVEYLLSHEEITNDEKLTSKDRHALMNYIGFSKNANFELKIEKNREKTVILCSDGLYNNASDKQIFSALRSNERLDQKILTLIGIAKANGGTDNIAISVWEPYKND